MEYTTKTRKARSNASIKWQKENYKRIPLDVRPEDKERIITAAKAAGMTTGGYIKQAIEEKIARDATRATD